MKKAKKQAANKKLIKITIIIINNLDIYKKRDMLSPSAQYERLIKERVMRLTDAPTGRQCIVTSLNRADENAFCRLIAMGIFPGAKLRLVQRYPLPVCEVGRCRLAIDCALAENINVK